LTFDNCFHPKGTFLAVKNQLTRLLHEHHHQSHCKQALTHKGDLPAFMIKSRIPASSLLLAVSMVMSVGASGQQASSNRDWATVQTLLKGIHGISTAPPDKIVTPKYTTGALMGNGDIGVVVGDTTTSQRFYFGKSDFWGTHWNTGHKAPEVSIISLGYLTVSSPSKTTGADSVYRMDQDILNAQVLTTLKLGEATVRMRSWTADGENIFATELSTDAGSPDVPLQLDLAMPAPDAVLNTVFPAAAGGRNGVLWASRENNLTESTDYKSRAAIAVRLLGASFSEVKPGSTNAVGSFVLKGGKPVWLITVFESDSRIGLSGTSSEALVQSALDHAHKVTPSRVVQLEQAHHEWWKQFWLKSFVQVHDKVLEDYYYGAQYVMGSSSRPGHLPPSLWSNFLTTDNAGWGGRYFMNYNEEAPFYGVFSSNHADLAEPYNRMILAQIPWQKNRIAAAGYKGVSFQRTFSPFTMYQPAPASEPIAPVKNYKKLPSDQKSNATFSVLPLIEYYEYTKDETFLRTKLYPAMKDLDAFWRDFAVRNAIGTQWIFEHSSAHEGGDDVNPNLDLGFARRVARELIETSRVLGVDAEMQPQWQQFIDQLASYPQGTVNGKTVYYIAASIKNNIKNQGLFEPGDQPINLEGLVYPGENLAIGGDAQQLQIARDSMEEMNSWGVSHGGNTNNGFCKIFPIAARIGWPADDLVAKFKGAILHQWRPSNLTVFQGGGGIETSGSVEALDSMLLQHEDGVLRLFPDWPSAMDASFTRLRAKGAFLVSSEQHAGAVSYVDVVSEKGGPLVILSPWGSKAVSLSSTAKSGKNKLQSANNGQITLSTVPGGHYHLTAK
jgi:hypothetical protein